MENRVCYGYTVETDGELASNVTEAKIQTQRVFKHTLEKQGVVSPTGKPKWNCEAISNLLSNEKYAGSVLLQKTMSLCGTQFKNDGELAQVLIKNHHDAIISTEDFQSVQERKVDRSKVQTQEIGMILS